MVKATLDGFLLAQSDYTIFLEGNHYFPPTTANHAVFSPSQTTYTCPWKGDAFYYNATVNDKTVDDIAWVYPHPKEAASKIAGHVAFDKDKVKIDETE